MSDSAAAPAAAPQEEKEEKQKQKQQQKGGGGGNKGQKRAVLKVPKGTKDYAPEAMKVRELVFAKVTEVYKRHGAVTIETPLFELKETLTSKYGEDSKLIYDLQDQGGELCSLRYDLTVPFARYCAMNRVRQLKRFHIARVYRRDQPMMNRGRYREFYQCDLDIAGEYDLMLPDAECLKAICEVLDSLALGNYTIKLNHRKLLDGFFAICGVPEDNFRAISSAVDKLDKMSWEDVRKEMVVDKGLDAAVADKIQTFVELSGEPKTLLASIRERGLCDSSEVAVAALAELEVLFDYCEAYGVLEKISFDLSLARGLDYYTGVIFEAVLLGKDGQGLGSIAAGGRYDELIGMFGNTRIPAVGVSLGIERCFAILEKRYKQEKNAPRPSETDVMVVTAGSPKFQKTREALLARLQLCRELWDSGIKAESLPKNSPKTMAQLKYANDQGIPFAVVFGDDELANGTVQVKDLTASTQDEVKREDLVADLQRRIAKFYAPKDAAMDGDDNGSSGDKTEQ